MVCLISNLNFKNACVSGPPLWYMFVVLQFVLLYCDNEEAAYITFQDVSRSQVIELNRR